MILSLIVAMAKNRVIGKDGRLPWHLPEDLKYFRDTTRFHPVIMGRKTYASIGKPLPDRDNFVITRQAGFSAPGVTTFASVEDTLLRLRERYGDSEVFVIGGAEIYRQVLPEADRIYVTVVNAEFSGDTYFPEFSEEEFDIKIRRESPGTPPLSFLVYERKKTRDRI